MKKIAVRFIALVMVACLAGSTAAGQASSRAVDAEGHQWWQHAVFYEIYPRSFADSNNDGVGDLKGITSKLDYLKDLGVDAIWITPCFPSPQVDFGYDVSDYENIDPMYGTLADFDVLAQRGQEAGHPHHPRFRRQSHFGSTQMVSGFEVVAHVRASRLVHLARWKGAGTSLQTTGSRRSGDRRGSSIRPRASITTIISMRSSRI